MSHDLLVLATFAVLIGVFVAFILERIEPHLIALTGMILLLIIGAISTGDMLDVFSNSAPITIACMFVISAALDQTGVVDSIGRLFLRISTWNKYLGMIAMILLVVVLSAFMNNTPVVIILAPVVITLANKLKDYPSKYLIPLSYAAILGGTCTLIGSSTNILVSGVAQEYGQAPFSMFEISGAGVIMAAAGLLFMAVTGRFLLPERSPPKDDVLDVMPVKRFMAEAIIPLDSPLIGCSINEIKFTESEDYEIIDLVRRDIGARMAHSPSLATPKSLLTRIFKLEETESEGDKAPIVTSFRDVQLLAGDRLVFKLSKDEIIEMQHHVGLDFDSDKAHISESLPTQEFVVTEGVIPPTSNFIGRQIKALKLRRMHGCFVIALHRRDKNITGDLPNQILKEGDSLILEGSEADLDRLFNEGNILTTSYMRRSEFNSSKALISIATLFAVVGLSAAGTMPIVGLAMIGAVTVILTGCVTPEQAHKTIDWRILMLIFGMLAIGTAMDNTGAMRLIVDLGVPVIGSYGPLFLLAAIYLFTSILTEMITNNAVAVLLTPIAIGLAISLGYDPRPFVVAVMFGASASFATPIGYQTNTFVYAAGGYKFKDFLKIGIPMNIIMLIVAVLVIPLFWPF